MTQDIRYVEGDPDEPLTRGEFNEALQSVHAAFDRVGADIQQLGARMDRRIDELFEHIDAAVENRLVDVGAARSDEVLLIKDQADPARGTDRPAGGEPGAGRLSREASK